MSTTTTEEIEPTELVSTPGAAEQQQVTNDCCLSKSLDFSIEFDLEKIIAKYSSGNATWDESARKTFSSFLHHFLIYVLMNRGEDHKKVFTLKPTSSEAVPITNYMKEHTPSKPVEKTKLEDPTNYTSADLFEEITTENFDSDLQKFAYSEAVKALYKYANLVEQQGTADTVTHQMIHLSFDFERVKEFILKYFDFHQEPFVKQVTLRAICSGFASLLEYTAAEIIELSTPYLEDGATLTISSIRKGLQSDPALLSLPCTHVILNSLP